MSKAVPRVPHMACYEVIFISTFASFSALSNHLLRELKEFFLILKMFRGQLNWEKQQCGNRPQECHVVFRGGELQSQWLIKLTNFQHSYRFILLFRLLYIPGSPKAQQKY
jgi:hypothetical protein